MEYVPILTGIISAAMAIFGAYAATKRVADEQTRKHADAIARLETKVDVLSERVEKHNQVMERTYKLEARLDALDVKIGGTE